MNPKKSLELLRALKEPGFTDEAFSRLPHFRFKDRKDHISSHQGYCKKTASSQGDGQKEIVSENKVGLAIMHFPPAVFGATHYRIKNIETLGSCTMIISCGLATVSARNCKNNSGQRTSYGGTIR